MSKRSEYIQDNYDLSFAVGQWVATMKLRGTVLSEICGADRDDVCREARGLWGHFNFEDEARAFGAIFSTGDERKSSFAGHGKL